ncbi:hypothetical protein GmHk_12G034490 [Glycine max]|nr:hypothetical protein GmHk_12G034490 [Glycine max]
MEQLVLEHFHHCQEWEPHNQDLAQKCHHHCQDLGTSSSISIATRKWILRSKEEDIGSENKCKEKGSFGSHFSDKKNAET